jgi:hypothetical protein
MAIRGAHRHPTTAWPSVEHIGIRQQQHGHPWSTSASDNGMAIRGAHRHPTTAWPSVEHNGIRQRHET